MHRSSIIKKPRLNVLDPDSFRPTSNLVTIISRRVAKKKNFEADRTTTTTHLVALHAYDITLAAGASTDV